MRTVCPLSDTSTSQPTVGTSGLYCLSFDMKFVVAFVFLAASIAAFHSSNSASSLGARPFS